MNKFIVYCAKFPNNKKYVGVTGRTLSLRIKDHKNSKKNNPFHNALRKYYNSVIWGVVKEFASSSEAYLFEQQLIVDWNLLHPNGYNYTLGGEYATGYKLPPFSEERRRKMSERAKKRIGNKNPFYGKTHSAEVKTKLSKLRSKPVIDNLGNTYSSALEVAKLLNLSVSHVCCCIKNKKYLKNRLFQYV